MKLRTAMSPLYIYYLISQARNFSNYGWPWLLESMSWWKPAPCKSKADVGGVPAESTTSIIQTHCAVHSS